MQQLLAFDICAVIIAVITAIYFFTSPKIRGLQTYLFAVAAVITVLVPALNIAAVLLSGKAGQTVLTVISILYTLLLHSLLAIMAFYMLVITARISSYKKWLLAVIALPYLSAAALILSTSSTGFITYVEDMVLKAGGLSFYLYIVAILYIVFYFAVMFFSRERLAFRRRIAIVFVMAIQIGAVCLQFLFNKILVVDLAAAVSLLILYISIQSSVEITDPFTKAYNYSIFINAVTERLYNKNRFFVIGFAFNDLRHIREIYGEDSAEALIKFVVQQLKATGGLASRVYGDEFCVLLANISSIDEVYEIAEALPASFTVGSYDIPFTASKVILDSLDFSSHSSMREVMEFTFRTIKEDSGGRTVIVDKSLIERFNRREKVKAAIVRAIGDNSINVVYQPIINAYTGEVFAAEALARLDDPILGVVPPDEFIVIAEQNGLIFDLGACVRKKVWALVREYDIKTSGLDHVSVNLSVLECTQRSVMETIIRESKSAGVESGIIHFEITETAAAMNKEVLAQNINMMRAEGFEFYLDDFGTGYSSVTNLISLPFSMIKLDRSITTLSMDPQRGEFVRRMVEPLHGYGLKIVLEGIEDERQANKARAWGVDYFQGYLYSEPLELKSFIEFTRLKKRQAKGKETARV
ncbi:MAG: GGDEF domain-containing phosphodiesterase [Eubacteriales bacterium]